MFNGKMKAVTFSYDDGVTQDRKLIEILDKYNLKSTFNLNSGLLGTSNSIYFQHQKATVAHCKPKISEVPDIYKGHEVAAHTFNHPNLTDCDKAEIIRQVNADKAALEAIVGYEIVGMAYPGGGVNYNSFVSDTVRNNTSLKYARTIVCTENFDLQDNLLEFKPTVFHVNFEKTFELAEEFIKMKPETPKLFYIWGHSYEFDVDDRWSRFEEFCKLISNRDDIFYGTNKEVLLG